VSSSRARADMTPLVLFTVGHSTRTIDEFVHLLKAHGIQHVGDVRSIPRSRHNPHFSRDHLSPVLHRFHIHYSHMPGLGGRRHARRDSSNTGWRNVSFRGYADYMETTAFKESLNRCIALAHRRGRRDISPLGFRYRSGRQRPHGSRTPGTHCWTISSRRSGEMAARRRPGASSAAPMDKEEAAATGLAPDCY
jgi:hypothetical protein